MLINLIISGSTLMTAWGVVSRVVVGQQQQKSGFFLSRCSAKMLGCDIMLYAVWKSTREQLALVRDRVLPWYMRGGFGREKSYVHLNLTFFISNLPPTYQGCTFSFTNAQYSLIDFQSAYNMTSQPGVLGKDLDRKNQDF